MEAALGPDTHARYAALAAELIEAGELKDLAYGVDREVLAAILNTLPVELSFVDQDDTVRYFSHERDDQDLPAHARRHRRQGAELPPAEERARGEPDPGRLQGGQARRGRVLARDGRRASSTSATGRCATPDGRYLGCLETVQDVAGIRALSGQKRLLD